MPSTDRARSDRAPTSQPAPRDGRLVVAAVVGLPLLLLAAFAALAWWLVATGRIPIAR